MENERIPSVQQPVFWLRIRGIGSNTNKFVHFDKERYVILQIALRVEFNHIKIKTL